MADLGDCPPFSDIFAYLNRIEQKLDQLQASVDRALAKPHAEAKPVLPTRTYGSKQPKVRPAERMPHEYLTRQEAAEYLRLSSKTLANWTSAGTGPKATKLANKRIRYRVSDLDEFLEAGGDARR